MAGALYISDMSGLADRNIYLVLLTVGLSDLTQVSRKKVNLVTAGAARWTHI